MKPHSSLIIAVIFLTSLGSKPAFAQDAPEEEAGLAGHFYGVGLIATTLALRPGGGSFDGPQEDITVDVGVGYFLSDEFAVEIDIGPTFVSGEYVALALVPAVIEPRISFNRLSSNHKDRTV